VSTKSAFENLAAAPQVAVTEWATSLPDRPTAVPRYATSSQPSGFENTLLVQDGQRTALALLFHEALTHVENSWSP
jgi:hypothetical protein